MDRNSQNSPASLGEFLCFFFILESKGASHFQDIGDGSWAPSICSSPQNPIDWVLGIIFYPSSKVTLPPLPNCGHCLLHSWKPMRSLQGWPRDSLCSNLVGRLPYCSGWIPEAHLSVTGGLHLVYIEDKRLGEQLVGFLQRGKCMALSSAYLGLLWEEGACKELEEGVDTLFLQARFLMFPIQLLQN